MSESRHINGHAARNALISIIVMLAVAGLLLLVQLPLING
jgi:ABC-type dipeptide/oligopeptide/nickel transport system permease component